MDVSNPAADRRETIDRSADASAGSATRRPSKGPIGGIAKRTLDTTFALICIILFSPLFLLVALAIKLTSPGPVLFGHTRIGHNGARFRCWKFRTMVTDGDTVLERHLASHPSAQAEWQETRKLRHDPRVTRLGQALRDYSVDELPQLLNVFLGQMSLVGPRPVVHDELERYGHAAEAYLAARPGITGLWQTSGRSDTTYEHRVALDRRYVSEWTFALDCLIILRTIPVVLGAKGAC